MIRVKATERGQYDGRIREIDEVFDVASKNKLAHWMEIVPVMQQQTQIHPPLQDAGPDSGSATVGGSQDTVQGEGSSEGADPVHSAPGAEAGASEVNGPGTALGDVNQKAIDAQSAGGNEFLK